MIVNISLHPSPSGRDDIETLELEEKSVSSSLWSHTTSGVGSPNTRTDSTWWSDDVGPGSTLLVKRGISEGGGGGQSDNTTTQILYTSKSSN